MKDDPIRIQIQNADPNKKLIKDLVLEFTKDLEWHLKLNEITAKLKRSQYDAYMKEGFTEQQTLFLIK